MRRLDKYFFVFLFFFLPDFAFSQTKADKMFLVAVEAGNEEEMIHWLGKGANINVVDPKTNLNALHTAAQNDVYELAEWLIKQGANVNFQNSDGNSPLMVAAANGYLRICYLLHREEAILDLKDNNGFTATHYAQSWGHIRVSEFLNNSESYSTEPTYLELFKSSLSFKEQQDYVKAIEYGEKAKVHAERELRKNHQYLLFTIDNLTDLYKHIGNYLKVEEYALQALAIRKEIQGEQSSNYAISLNNMGALYEEMKEYDNAEKYYLQALATQKKSRGDKNPNYATFLKNLGGVYGTIGEYQKAETCFLQALTIRKEILGEKHSDYVASLINLGSLYYTTKEYQKAEEYFVSALTIREKVVGKKHPEYIMSLRDLGELYEKMGNYQKSEEHLLQALDTQREILGNKHVDYAMLLNKIGLLYSTTGQYQKAENYYLQAITLRKDILGLEHPDYAISLNNLASLYEAIGYYQKAEEYAIKALAIQKKVHGEEHSDYATSLSNLASLYSSMGQYQKAEQHALQALTIRKEIFGEQHAQYAISLNNMGLLYIKTSNYQKGEKFLLQAISIVKENNNKSHPDYALYLSNVGGLYSTVGDYQEAERCYQEALSIQKELFGEKHPRYVTSLSHLAVLYSDMGQYQQAEKYLLQVLLVRKEILGEHHADYASTLNDLGVFYERIGDYIKSETYWQQALDLRKEIFGEQHPDYAASLNNLGLSYETRADYAKAEQYYLKAVDIIKNNFGEESPDYATALNNLATLYQTVRDYKKSEEYSLKAFSVRKKTFSEHHPDYVMSLNNLGKLYEEMGEYKKAESYLLQAHNLQRAVHPDYITTSDNLATLYTTTEDYDKAEPLFLESSALIRKDILRNFDFLSEKQREHYWKKNQGLFEFYPSFIYAYYPKKKSISAFAYDNELFRKGLLLNTSAEINNSILHSNDDDLQRDWNDLRLLRTQINSMQHLPLSEQSGLDSLEIRAEYLDKEIIKRSVSYRENRESLQIKWQEVQKNLEKGEVAIEFVAFDCYHKEYTDSLLYYALVLRKESDYPVLIPLFEESQLSALLKDNNPELSRRIQKLYNGSNPRFYNGQKLYDLVWKPLEQHLQDIKTVYYSPSGLLHRIAFSAIPVDTMWLNEKYNLHLLSSTREIVRLKKQEDSFLPIKQATSYGGILYDIEDAEKLIQSAQQYKTREPSYFASRSLPRDSTRSGWAYLQGTEKEVTEISDILKQSNISNSTITGIVANEESFKALSGNSPELLHIATHGFFLEDEKKIRESGFMNRLNHQNRPYVNPLLRSGLLFAGANRAWQNENIIPDIEDGILTAEEISHLDLSNTKLVVLSACETGLGEVQNSEGVFGLQRAFKLAGVETLVMSLWEVDDSTTSKFMVTFYQNLMAGKSKSDAFDIAQQTIRKEHSNPYYWAGFVMMD